MQKLKLYIDTCMNNFIRKYFDRNNQSALTDITLKLIYVEYILIQTKEQTFKFKLSVFAAYIQTTIKCVNIQIWKIY